MKNRNKVRWTLCDPGIASKRIKTFRVRPGDRFILICRVSRRQQKSHLQHQRDALRKLVESMGGIVIAVYMIQTSGQFPEWLYRAACHGLRTGATLLAETTDRFIRNSSYHSQKRPHLQPTESELVDLEIATEGVQLMTVVHPDAPLSKCRRFQMKRGQDASGAKVGRRKAKPPGYKKRLREQHLPKALEQYHLGKSYGQIAKSLGIAKQTVYDWIQQALSE